MYPIVSHVTDTPKPLFVVEFGDVDPNMPRVDYMEAFRQIEAGSSSLELLQIAVCRFRGLAFSAQALERVLTTGIDVTPTTARFYADAFEKAMEYVRWPGLMLAIDGEPLRRVAQLIRAGMTPDDVADMRTRYPVERTDARGRVWLSRPDVRDTGSGFQYEIDYGYWNPGNALDALRAVMVLPHPRLGGSEEVSRAVDRWRT